MWPFTDLQQHSYHQYSFKYYATQNNSKSAEQENMAATFLEICTDDSLMMPY